MEVLTATQMRALEQAAMQAGEVTGLTLMERAGQGVVEAIAAHWPELAPADAAERGASPSRSPEYFETKDARRAVVFCGPGNNGGDGFVVARMLAAQGWAVSVFLFGEAARLPEDARCNYERWHGIGAVGGVDGLAEAVDGCDLFVDAGFGIGLTRPLPPDLCAVARLLRESGVRRVAVDVPSGLCSESGRSLGRGPDGVFCSDLTVTFHTAKPGHYLADGPGICGTLIVKGIGLRSGPPETGLRLARVADGLDKARGHKFHHGHALVLSGGPGKTGAARLAARGALRIGAGLVTLGVPPDAQQEVASQITALMVQRVADADQVTEVLSDARFTALCLGPGFGLDEKHAARVEAALRSGRPTVLDADALTLIAQRPELAALVHATCVLTPHAGEFQRLFPDLAERLAAPAERGPATSKVEVTRAAAARIGAVVLYKGPDTVIAAPDGRCVLHAAAYGRRAPWLATAGSGDVLAGFITGLLARGVAPLQAAETGARLHVDCARSFGPGLIAEDLPEELPKVLRAQLA